MCHQFWARKLKLPRYDSILEFSKCLLVLVFVVKLGEVSRFVSKPDPISEPVCSDSALSGKICRVIVQVSQIFVMFVMLTVFKGSKGPINILFCLYMLFTDRTSLQHATYVSVLHLPAGFALWNAQYVSSRKQCWITWVVTCSVWVVNIIGCTSWT